MACPPCASLVEALSTSFLSLVKLAGPSGSSSYQDAGDGKGRVPQARRRKGVETALEPVPHAAQRRRLHFVLPQRVGKIPAAFPCIAQPPQKQQASSSQKFAANSSSSGHVLLPITFKNGLLLRLAGGAQQLLVWMQPHPEPHPQLAQREIAPVGPNCSAESQGQRMKIADHRGASKLLTPERIGLPAGASSVAMVASSSMVQVYSRQSVSAVAENVWASPFWKPM